jgi:YbbR domain-containing protein
VPDVPVLNPATVNVSGAQSLINNVTQAIAPVVLNGETTSIDEKVTAQIQDVNGNIIPGVTIDPSQVEVKDGIIKPGITSTVGIQPVITGQPSNGYWVSSVSTSPSVVTITGSPSALQAVSSINTAPISVNGVGASETVTSNLTIPTGITLTDTSITQVSVTITLSSVSTTKTITPQISFKNLAQSLTVSSTTPTSISAVVSGSASILTALSDGSVVVSVDLSAYQSAGTYSVNIVNAEFTTPTGVSLVSFLPSTISVTLVNK